MPVYNLSGNSHLSQIQGTGVFLGGEISINADTTKINVSAGMGYVVDNYTNPESPTISLVKWDTFTAVTLTYLATNLDTQLAINGADATLTQFNTLLTAVQRRDYLFLGKAVHTNLTVVNAVVNNAYLRVSPQMTIDDLHEAVGPINKSGNVISANGANLSINRSAGEIYRRGANRVASAKSPNLITTSAATPVSFQYRYRNGSGGFTTSAATTTLVPGSYDDGDGTLGAVGNSQWTIQRVYHFTIGTTYVTYGQVIYATLAEAEAATDVEDPVIDPQFADASLRAYVIMRGNATDLTDTAITAIKKNGKFNP